MHILATRYLENVAFHFTEVTRNDKKTNKDDEKAETVKKALYKEKKDK